MPPRFARLAAALRDFDWLTPERARLYSRTLLVGSLAIAVAWIVLAQDGVDRQGKAIGTDFVSFWTASKLTWEGRPDLAYDVGAHWAAQKALFGPDIGYTAFFYPPPYLLVCLPLAALPYFWSLAAWLAATGALYGKMVHAYLPEDFDALALLAFPAILINVGQGQNGFLTAALLGGGLLIMDRRPILAGVLFGLLAFKPQLALMLPVALIAARRWATIAAAAATALAFAAAAWLAFGTVTWRGFFAGAVFARAVLEQNLVGYEKMQSVFAAVRLLHGPLALAYGAQIVVALGAAAAIVVLQRRAFRSTAEAPAVAAATLLASPFLLDYDLTLLAVPLAWTFREARRAGFLPGEKALLALAFALPLVARVVAGALLLPLSPPTVVAVLALVLRRALAPQRATAPGGALNRAGAPAPLSLAAKG